MPNWWQMQRGVFRGELDDPRWADGPLTPFVVDNRSDNIKHRMLLSEDGRVLGVQILVRNGADQGGPDGSDEVYFGLSAPTPEGEKAWVVKLSPTTAAGLVPQVPDEAVLQHWTYQGGTWTSFPFESPGWLVHAGIWNDVTGDRNPETRVKDPASTSDSDPSYRCGEIPEFDTAACNDERHKGFGWAINMAIDLGQLTFQAGGQAGNLSDPQVELRFTSVVRTVNALGAPSYYRTPNNESGCVGGCPPGPDSAPFHPVPREWKPFQSRIEPCAGSITLDRDRIGTNNPGLRSSEVFTAAGRSNAFEATPYADGHDPLELPDLFRARFRISNWGTVADPYSDWNDLPNGSVNNPEVDLGNPNEPNPTGTLGFTCANGTSGRNVCGVVDSFYDVNSEEKLHQCMLVELEVLNPQLATVADAAVYRNTQFGDLSTYSATAEISVRGLQSLLGNDNPRDVYLNVVTRKMPRASSDKMSVNVAALDAARAQSDFSFSREIGNCSHPRDFCLPVGESGGACVHYCGGPDGLDCTGNRRPFVLRDERTCICIPDVDEEEMETAVERCSNVTMPEGGGWDPNLTSLSPSQQLEYVYPNYEVFPFYDSGRTENINGSERPVLVPMPSFSIFVRHPGDFYGYLHSLVTEDGTPPINGTDFEEIAPNFYRLRVPNEGVRRIKVAISAEETPHYAPMSELLGTALTVGWNLGNANVTGITHALADVDLSRAEVTLDRLLGDGARELVTKLSAAVKFRPLPGATSSAATFTSSALPGALIQINKLPLIGQVVSIAINGSSIERPTSCGLWFGTTHLETRFEVSDGTNRVGVRAMDQWSCIPGKLYNL
jgi:hypothetical protein